MTMLGVVEGALAMGVGLLLGEAVGLSVLVLVLVV
jgi:hypothetical protein